MTCQNYKLCYKNINNNNHHIIIKMIIMHICKAISCLGLGFGISFIPVISVVSSYFDIKRNVAVGIVVSGVGMGTFVYLPMHQLLMYIYGWCSKMNQFVVNSVLNSSLHRKNQISIVLTIWRTNPRKEHRIYQFWILLFLHLKILVEFCFI